METINIYHIGYIYIYMCGVIEWVYRDNGKKVEASISGLGRRVCRDRGVEGLWLLHLVRHFNPYDGIPYRQGFAD